jgi:hypothetical protein
MIKKYIPILLFIVCVVASSCTQQKQPCVEPILVSLRFSVLSTHWDSALARRVTFDTLLPNGELTPIGAQNNIPYYFGTTAQFSLFLDPNKDSCKWYLSQMGGDSIREIIDTITFFYTRKLQFLSNACGYTYYYNLTTIPGTPNLRNNVIQNYTDTLHKIDSIIIENAGVTNNVNLEHLQIYIRDSLK